MYQRISKPDHGSLEWLSLRWRDDEGRCRFGASEAPSLMGVSPYMSRGDLYAAKIGAPQVGEQTDAFRRGHLLEPVLLAEAGRLLGTEIVQPDEMYATGRWIVTLDGADALDPSVIVEAKTTTRYAIRSREDLPAEWLWQVWVQSAVCGAPAFIVALDRDQRISLTEVEANASAWDALQEEAEALGAAVDNEEPLPPEEFSAAQIAEIWKPQPRVVELPESARSWLLQLDEARKARSEAEKREAEAKDEIARLMLDAEIGTIGGATAVTWKQQAAPVRLDTKRLREEHPDLIAAYETKGSSFRVMRLIGLTERL